MDPSWQELRNHFERVELRMPGAVDDAGSEVVERDVWDTTAVG
jgi:hypothetical protein